MRLDQFKVGDKIINKFYRPDYWFKILAIRYFRIAAIDKEGIPVSLSYNPCNDDWDYFKEVFDNDA